MIKTYDNKRNVKKTEKKIAKFRQEISKYDLREFKKRFIRILFQIYEKQFKRLYRRMIRDYIIIKWSEAYGGFFTPEKERISKEEFYRDIRDLNAILGRVLKDDFLDFFSIKLKNLKEEMIDFITKVSDHIREKRRDELIKNFVKKIAFCLHKMNDLTDKELVEEMFRFFNCLREE